MGKGREGKELALDQGSARESLVFVCLAEGSGLLAESERVRCGGSEGEGKQKKRTRLPSPLLGVSSLVRSGRETKERDLSCREGGGRLVGLGR